MELKSKSLRFFAASWRGSNRTFMELKWSRRPLPAAQSFSSNRTFMELKYIKQEERQRTKKMF